MSSSPRKFDGLSRSGLKSLGALLLFGGALFSSLLLSTSRAAAFTPWPEELQGPPPTKAEVEAWGKAVFDWLFGPPPPCTAELLGRAAANQAQYMICAPAAHGSALGSSGGAKAYAWRPFTAADEDGTSGLGQDAWLGYRDAAHRGARIGVVVDFLKHGQHLMARRADGKGWVPVSLTTLPELRPPGGGEAATLTLAGRTGGPAALAPGEDDRLIDQRIYLMPGCTSPTPWAYETAGVRFGFFRRLEKPENKTGPHTLLGGKARAWTYVAAESLRTVTPISLSYRKRPVCDGSSAKCSVRCMTFSDHYHEVQLNDILLPEDFQVEERDNEIGQRGPVLVLTPRGRRP